MNGYMVSNHRRHELHVSLVTQVLGVKAACPMWWRGCLRRLPASSHIIDWIFKAARPIIDVSQIENRLHVNTNHRDQGREEMVGLPPFATEDSRIRYKLAQTLVNLAPSSFGRESVLTGSASRGVADNYSDIEMMFYVDALPSREDLEAWLHDAGAANIVLDTETPGDDEVWATFYIGNKCVEAGWRVIVDHERDIDNIVAGNVIAHQPLTLAWVMTHAVSLHSIGYLSQWQQILAHYPKTLPQKIIDSINEYWTVPQGFAIRWALLSRDEPMALTERLLGEMRFMLRILFAIKPSMGTRLEVAEMRNRTLSD